jgi:RNase P subunit RPR2
LLKIRGADNPEDKNKWKSFYCINCRLQLAYFNYDIFKFDKKLEKFNIKKEKCINCGYQYNFHKEVA